MNKLTIENGKITEQVIDSTLSIEEQSSTINRIKITAKMSTSLEIWYQGNDKSKCDITWVIEENNHVFLQEIRTGNAIKIQHKYYLEQNSKITINELSLEQNTKENTIIYLNGEGASIHHVGKVICKNPEFFDFVIHHNAPKTESNILEHGINIENGNLHFRISSFVPKNKKQCIANQDTRIMNFTDQICQIEPNLFIDEFDVEANHAAYIGGVKEDELFYLTSRGIPQIEATHLLVQGFLKSNLEKTTISVLESIVNREEVDHES